MKKTTKVIKQKKQKLKNKVIVTEIFFFFGNYGLCDILISYVNDGQLENICWYYLM